MTRERVEIRGPIGIVGTGRAAEAIAAALTGSGCFSVTIWGRSAARATAAARRAGCHRTSSLGRLARGSRLALIAVADEAVAEVSSELAASLGSEAELRVALHTSGSQGTDPLAELRDRGVSVGVLHPALSLHGHRSRDAFAGSFFTVSGERSAVRAARSLVKTLGARALTVGDAHRPLIHLAAVMAAGDVVALLGAAERLLVSADIAERDARKLVGTLAASVLTTYLSKGATTALTGPVARADESTLRRHRDALHDVREEHPLAADVHRSLVEQSASLLVDAGRLTPSEASRLLRALESD